MYVGSIVPPLGSRVILTSGVQCAYMVVLLLNTVEVVTFSPPLDAVYQPAKALFASVGVGRELRLPPCLISELDGLTDPPLALNVIFILGVQCA